MAFLLTIFVIIILMTSFTKFYLQGEDLSKYDRPDITATFETDPNSEGAKAVAVYLHENFTVPAKTGTPAEQLAAKRARFEQMGLARDFHCTHRQDTVIWNELKVPGEWTLVEGANPDQRLLYIHGGANTVGSAISHRALTYNIAKRTGCSVFAPNYRLMPENSRMAGVEDVRATYQWILENGPDGPASIEKLAIAGDSAGGNLALSAINWARDAKLRAADAVIALSPAVDTTCSSPTIQANYETDIMLKPLVARMLKIPRPALLWFLWRGIKMSPASPIVSPIFADLSHLPPTLVQVSTAEMLHGDAQRYVEKATQQGSPALLQSWAHMAHVWQAFDRTLPEAHQAFDEMATFLAKHDVGVKT